MTHPAPLLSILLPIHNGERFLAEAVESVLSQTFRNFELLLLDDASTDSTPEILHAFAQKDERVRVIRNETNLRLAGTLNKGLGLCRGEFVARMDADDICEPQRFEKQVALLQEQPTVAVCGTWATTIGDVAGHVFRHPSDHDSIRALLLFDCALVHPSVMLRRQAFVATDLFYNPAFEGSEDYELWIRLSKQHRFANIPESLLRYRVHATPLKQGNRYDATTIIRPAKRILLEELFGNSLSETEIDQHEAIGRWKLERSADFLRKSDTWLRRVLTANAQKGNVYAADALQREVCHRWFSICCNAIPLGFGTWLRYALSPLAWRGEHGLKDCRDLAIECLRPKKRVA